MMGDTPASPVAPVPASPLLALSASNLRKERGAIAAQACDTCRSRKQRCDEQRPKCSTCQKFGLECNYRIPQPTKKDKTLLEILDRIKGLEAKVDSLNLRNTFASPTAVHGHLPPGPTTGSDAPMSLSGHPLSGTAYSLHDASSTTSGTDEHFKYVCSVHQMLAWPAIRQVLAAAQQKLPTIDLGAVEREKPAGLFQLGSTASRSLPTHTPYRVMGPGPTANGPTPTFLPITMSDLNWDSMQRLSKAYFDSFNLLCPVLDRHFFLSSTLPSVFSEGFSQDMASTIAFLVFALGEVALAGSSGPPIHVSNRRPSGVKGGSKDIPPGLDFFNEARKRMGFNLTDCSIENVQIFFLASIYYGTSFYPMDFWRMSTSASLACQALLASTPAVMSSPRGDMVRRLFWNCSNMETLLNLEFGLTPTGLEKIESVVGLPDFSGPFSDEDHISNQESHYQEHFASQIVLRRLLVEFHGVLSQGMSIRRRNHPILRPADFSIRLVSLALQLEQWRGMLPPQLRWHEESSGAFPNTSMYSPSLYSTIPTSTPMTTSLPPPNTAIPGSASPLMFTTDLDAVPVRYPYSLDIQVALLRSRYYHTKYLVHRPYLYKALHHPDAMTHDDALGAAECLKATLKWPVAMSPTCTRKRLIPCVFFFTQNLFGILLLLHLSTTVPILRRIQSTLCGERFEMDASETVGLYLDWMRDIKEVDCTAQWQWEVVKAVYGLEE
ncbi:hypothetical protein B0T18DRAFT_457602 [Schizothecium vesticola]|uniref:Zn(2)-C6 fungal-type domain-containing protein n=1 Tax=Schizothecium vesticola TaxID=314040 RepID=A0AA40F5S5_9PEZI|nr:hypothetical protein B0T18DRAFT_457602 [Schizothecium vesticola]